MYISTFVILFGIYSFLWIQEAEFWFLIYIYFIYLLPTDSC